MSDLKPGWRKGFDWSRIRGANYNPSYAANDVVFWHHYRHNVIDRELGYAEKLGLNSVRVFLQYLVYEHDKQRFLRNVEDFVETAQKHGIGPMLTLFDSCGIGDPSLQSVEHWVASPGPTRIGEEFYPKGEGYVRDLAELFEGDSGLLIWDVMNEPTVECGLFEERFISREKVIAFVGHFVKYLKKVDPTHPVSVGGYVPALHADRVNWPVDLASLHNYASPEKSFRDAIHRIRAKDGDTPLILSECCLLESPYEMALPAARDEKVGYHFWELMIGITQFRWQCGVIYPDGSIRRREHARAVLGREPEEFTLKPDSQGVPYGVPDDLDLQQQAMLRMYMTETTEENVLEKLSTAYIQGLLAMRGGLSWAKDMKERSFKLLDEYRKGEMDIGRIIAGAEEIIDELYRLKYPRRSAGCPIPERSGEKRHLKKG